MSPSDEKVAVETPWGKGTFHFGQDEEGRPAAHFTAFVPKDGLAVEGLELHRVAYNARALFEEVTAGDVVTWRTREPLWRDCYIHRPGSYYQDRGTKAARDLYETEVLNWLVNWLAEHPLECRRGLKGWLRQEIDQADRRVEEALQELQTRTARLRGLEADLARLMNHGE